MGFYERLFSRVDYRILMLLTPAIGLLLLPAAMNIPLGIDFTGGTEIQILTERHVTSSQLESALAPCSQKLNIALQDISGKTSIIIRTKDDISKECADSSFALLGFTQDELSRILPSKFKPELGKVLMGQGANVFIISGILMSLVVFIAFRTFIPSIAVIQAAAFDILIAMGVLSLAGFELNLAGVAALLMLIGYSVDTDIMLTSRLLRQTNKSIYDGGDQALVTGLTMTLTALAAMGSILIVTLFIRMDTIHQIASIIFVGLIADLGTTWLTNFSILKWHIEKNKSHKSESKLFKFSIFRS